MLARFNTCPSKHGYDIALRLCWIPFLASHSLLSSLFFITILSPCINFLYHISHTSFPFLGFMKLPYLISFCILEGWRVNLCSFSFSHKVSLPQYLVYFLYHGLADLHLALFHFSQVIWYTSTLNHFTPTSCIIDSHTRGLEFSFPTFTPEKVVY